MNPVFSARVKAGKLFITEHERFVDFLHSLPLECEVVVRERGKKDRSDSQNRYYFGVVVKIIADHLGEDKDRTHKLIKEELLSEDVTIKTTHGEVTGRVTRSTRSLTTKEFEEYLESVRIWASSELGISVPTPEEIE